jgi:hypothetical protein
MRRRNWLVLGLAVVLIGACVGLWRLLAPREIPPAASALLFTVEALADVEPGVVPDRRMAAGKDGDVDGVPTLAYSWFDPGAGLLVSSSVRILEDPEAASAEFGRAVSTASDSHGGEPASWPCGEEGSVIRAKDLDRWVLSSHCRRGRHVVHTLLRTKTMPELRVEFTILQAAARSWTWRPGLEPRVESPIVGVDGREDPLLILADVQGRAPRRTPRQSRKLEDHGDVRSTRYQGRRGSLRVDSGLIWTGSTAASRTRLQEAWLGSVHNLDRLPITRIPVVDWGDEALLLVSEASNQGAVLFFGRHGDRVVITSILGLPTDQLDDVVQDLADALVVASTWTTTDERRQQGEGWPHEPPSLQSELREATRGVMEPSSGRRSSIPSGRIEPSRTPGPLGRQRVQAPAPTPSPTSARPAVRQAPSQRRDVEEASRDQQR